MPDLVWSTSRQTESKELALTPQAIKPTVLLWDQNMGGVMGSEPRKLDRNWAKRTPPKYL